MTAIVFDLYQRYHFIESVISILSSNPSDRILEVGAIGSPIRKLLPERNLILLDWGQETEDLDLRANGMALPFRDHTFEIVVCTDVLEHLSASDREKFIAELQRVTSGTLILGFPHLDEKNVDADHIFYEFAKRYSSVDVRYLQEHKQHGLPEKDMVRDQLQSFVPHVLEFQNSNIGSWLLLQIANFTLLQHPEMEEVRTLINSFFNQSLEPVSHGPPCYRTFLVCSKRPLEERVKRELEEAGNSSEAIAKEYASKLFAFVSASEAAIQQTKIQLTAIKQESEDLANEKSRLESTLREVEHRESLQKQEIADLNRDVQVLKSTVRGQALVNQNLQEYLNLFLQHPAYKIYRAFKNSFQRFIKNGKSPSYDLAYRIFQNNCEPNAEELTRQSKEWTQLAVQPKLNIVTAVFEPPMDIFRETVNSVLQQTYPNWIWNVVDASEETDCWNLLVELATRDARVKPHRLSKNNGISANMNVALQQASGDYVVVLDHDDTLAPHALFSVARSIADQPDLDFLYSDADKLDESGVRCEPIFKPDWSPEMMLCCNLLNQISVFRRGLLNEVGYLNPEMDGAQDWDLYLRIAEKTQRIYHIPQILYHWRKTPQSCAQRPENKPYAARAQLKSIESHLIRMGRKNPQVGFDHSNPVHGIHPMSSWTVTSNHLVSIVIPTSDHSDVLSRCLSGLLQMTHYQNLEIILVDTASKEAETLQLYEKYAGDSRIKVIHNAPPFNFARACNVGANTAAGSLLLFLNNDIEILHKEWLNRMVQWFEWPEIGAVGPKLVYPDGKIQHAGIVVGLGGLAAHLFLGAKEHRSSIFGSDDWYRNVSAVTGACILIRKEAFEKVYGFDEEFQLNFSDVDLCLKVRQNGYRIVYTPQARLIHHESVTHRRRLPRVDFEKANERLKNWLRDGDPYFNANLSYRDPLPLFRNNPDDSCESTNRVLMKHMPRTEWITLPLQLPQTKTRLFTTLRS